MAGQGKPGPDPRTDWQEPFLEAYRLLGIQSEAARVARVNVSTVTDERKRNPEFAASYAASTEQANGVLLRYLHERATDGQKVKRVERRTHTVTDQDGKTVVTVIEATVETALISTPALLALCKARMPEMFDDRLRVVGADGGAVQVEPIYRPVTMERARELAGVVVELDEHRQKRASGE